MAEIVERPKSVAETAKDIAKRVFRQENTVLITVLVALIAVFGFASEGLTVTRVNMTNVLLQSSTRGVAAIGQAFVILTAGIDVSVGGMALFCVVLGMSMMTSEMYMNIIGFQASPYLGILAMIFGGIGWGAINGVSVSRIGMPALIVTLAVWQITTGFSFTVCQGRTVVFPPESMMFFGQGRILGVPVPIIIFISVAIVGYFVLSYTTYGRSVYAVGGNPVSAWLSGIDTKKILLSVYLISGALAGLAGVIMVGRTMSGCMRSMKGLEMDSIASATVGGCSLFGGRGSLIGVVIGALIIGVVNNSMSVLGAGPDAVNIVKGAIIFTAVAIDTVRRR